MSRLPTCASRRGMRTTRSRRACRPLSQQASPHAPLTSPQPFLRRLRQRRCCYCWRRHRGRRRCAQAVHCCGRALYLQPHAPRPSKPLRSSACSAARKASRHAEVRPKRVRYNAAASRENLRAACLPPGRRRDRQHPHVSVRRARLRRRLHPHPRGWWRPSPLMRRRRRRRRWLDVARIVSHPRRPIRSLRCRRRAGSCLG